MQSYILAPHDAFHGHTVDNVSIYTMIPLIVQDAFHGHFADEVIIAILRKIKPISGIVSPVQLPRLIIVDDIARIKNNSITKQKPQSSDLIGMRPIVIDKNGIPRIRDFPK